MPKLKFSDTLLYKVGMKFNKDDYCTITGLNTNLKYLIMHELEDPYSNEYGLLMKKEYKEEIELYLTNNYSINKNELKIFPALYLIGLIIFKFDYINEQLFSLLVSFLKSQDMEVKEKILIEYVQKIMAYKLFPLSNKNSYKVLLIEDKDSERDNIVISNGDISYSFKNLNNATKVCDFILEEELGVF